jgi:UDP-glucose 4-epimerase
LELNAIVKPVPVESDPPARRIARTAQWTDHGLAVVGTPLFPQQAHREDLLAVRDAIMAAQIPYLLVRGSNGRMVIAVDRKLRRELAAALAEAFREQPFYAATVGPNSLKGLEPVLIAEGRLSSHDDASVLRLFRPRIDPNGRVHGSAHEGIQLEFWRMGRETITAPRENALMRRSLPRTEAVEDTVTLYGVEWPTLQPMFTELASDVSFDIDLVFSWVDGSDDEFLKERARRMQSYVVGDGDDSPARYRQIDELKYALRSVYAYAPWIRRIFIATDSPAPSWLAEHPRVTIVRSEQFFADTSVLPTHNSHAVESQLHNIDGLAEHFLYSNDDMFFGRAVRPDLFFSPGGLTKFVEATTRIGLGDSHPGRSGFENAARVNRQLLLNRFGKVTTRHLEHCAAPLRRSVIAELENEFPEDFSRTAASRFRSATDVSVTNSLYHYYALMVGKAVQQNGAKVRYIETTLRSARDAMDELLLRRDQDMFCLNDGSRPEISVEERTEITIGFLEHYYPVPAPWEKVESEATATSVPISAS